MAETDHLMTMALLLSAALALASGPGARAPAVHDLHVSYGSSVVEDNTVVVRIRFFKDDLETALRRRSDRGDFTMTPGPETDSVFLSYFNGHFRIEVDGDVLHPVIVASGEDSLDREPVWWCAVQFEASVPVRRFRVRNTLLLELFDDQRNIVKFVHFPDEAQKTYSFGPGEEAFDVSFAGQEADAR